MWAVEGEKEEFGGLFEGFESPVEVGELGERG